jgi:hypothetical protein
MAKWGYSDIGGGAGYWQNIASLSVVNRQGQLWAPVAGTEVVINWTGSLSLDLAIGTIAFF